jgi:hypothetical protein
MAQIGEFEARLAMSSKNFSRPPGAPVLMGATSGAMNAGTQPAQNRSGQAH